MFGPITCLWAFIQAYPSSFMIKIKWVKFRSLFWKFILTCYLLVYRFILYISFSYFFKNFKLIHTMLIFLMFIKFYINFIEMFVCFYKIHCQRTFFPERWWNFARKLWWESTNRGLMIKTNIGVRKSWSFQQHNSLCFLFLFSFLI